jgi:hypothetical protein
MPEGDLSSLLCNDNSPPVGNPCDGSAAFLDRFDYAATAPSQLTSAAVSAYAH